ncbi:hypothetical protein ACFW1M_38685 [Streptomyces inhibens]|uniref:hypothetical protein n=1 Tax=Streptomyces inhibens TaxID=2293571 RepID=UPI003699CEDD
MEPKQRTVTVVGGRTNWFACAVAPEGQCGPGREIATLRAWFGHRRAGVRAAACVVICGALPDMLYWP